MFFIPRYSYFHGHCFNCHNFGDKEIHYITYETINTREARAIYNLKNRTHIFNNSFSPITCEIELSICNNFRHEESECRSKMIPCYQHKQKTQPLKVWKRKTTSIERCGLAIYERDQENQWYVDNGFLRHMTCERNKFISFNELKKEKNVSFGNNYPLLLKEKDL